MATYTFNGSVTSLAPAGTNSYQFGLSYLQTNNPATSLRLGTTTAAIAGARNTFCGVLTGTVNTAADITGLGFSAGKVNTTGVYNCYFGSESGLANTTGSFNTFAGDRSGKANIIGSYNSFFGSQAGQANLADDNSFFGTQAGFNNTTGSLNIAFGEIAGYYNTTGSSNCWIGLKAGYNYITASGNTIIGNNNTDVTAVSGSFNTIIGNNTTGYGNIGNTVIISDGSNTQNIIADVNSARFKAPVRPPSYTVALLPSAVNVGVGAIAYATNGRKAAEGVGVGTGVPVFSSGSAWLTFYGNTAVTA